MVKKIFKINIKRKICSKNLPFKCFFQNLSIMYLSPSVIHNHLEAVLLIFFYNFDSINIANLFTLNLPFLLTSATRAFRTTKLMWNSIICKKKWSFYLIICASDVIFIIRFCYRDKVFCSLSENHSLIELFGNGLILWYYKTVSYFFYHDQLKLLMLLLNLKAWFFISTSKSSFKWAGWLWPLF